MSRKIRLSVITFMLLYRNTLQEKYIQYKEN